MTDEELLSQTFMFGWAGQAPTDLLMSWITERSLGSIKIFGWNTEDSVELARLSAFTKGQQYPLPYPAFVATDQEGAGYATLKDVRRKRPVTSPSAPPVIR